MPSPAITIGMECPECGHEWFHGAVEGGRELISKPSKVTCPICATVLDLPHILVKHNPGAPAPQTED